MTVVPPDFVDTVRRNRGERAVEWARGLPVLIARLEERWDIEVAPAFPRISFNFAAPATCADGTRAVLKIAPPWDEEAPYEAAALAAFGGVAAARLLKHDESLGAILMERVEPGVPLYSLRDDDRETAIAARMMLALHRPPPAGVAFPTAGDWGLAFDRHRTEHGGSGPLPAGIFEMGERLYHELDASTTQIALLHGDFHHDNILSAERSRWLAIDPHGVVGDPILECGPYLNNLWPELFHTPDPAATLSRRVDIFAEILDVDRERVRCWGIAFCVLSAVWSAEDGGTDWGGAIAHANWLASGPS